MTTHQSYPFALILFDLDGTLTDPKPGITRCVQHALASFGVRVANPDALTPFIGPPLAESFVRHYGFTAEQARQAIAVYRERFASVGLYENALYPGIPEMLAELAAAGIELAVASSKPTIYVERILAHFGLAGYFPLVAGSNLDHTRVAKAEVIAYLLAEIGEYDAARTVMVGDREHDVFGARAHGLETIAVSYGYGSRQELTAARPRAIADSVAELVALLSAPTIQGAAPANAPG